MLVQRLLTHDKGGMVILVLLALLAVVVPILNLAVPPDFGTAFIQLYRHLIG